MKTYLKKDDYKIIDELTNSFIADNDLEMDIDVTLIDEDVIKSCVTYVYKEMAVRNNKLQWKKPTSYPKFSGNYLAIVRNNKGFLQRTLVYFNTSSKPKWATKILGWTYLPNLPKDLQNENNRTD